MSPGLQDDQPIAISGLVRTTKYSIVLEQKGQGSRAGVLIQNKLKVLFKVLYFVYFLELFVYIFRNGPFRKTVTCSENMVLCVG